MTTIDLHNHVIPKGVVDAIETSPERFGTRVERSNGSIRIIHQQGYAYPLFPEFVEVDAKIASLDARKIDVAAISPAPTMYFYWIETDAAVDIARRMNDGIADMVAARPDRLRGMASLPMQDPAAAIAELERVVRDHGFRSASIGTSIEGVHLSDPRYRAFLRRAEELDVFLFAHPYFIGDKCGMEPFYLTNLVGNPLETTMMVANLMFSGALEEVRDLRLLLAHGGGFMPYQIGRLMHGHAVRAEPKAFGAASPLTYARRFFYDSITHHPQALRYLIDLVGADHIAIGTDAPFDMGVASPVAFIDEIPRLTADERHQLCCGTARRLLRETD
jgi:aminocarboxymuconate-semialdehyde decarboxylase